MAASDTGAPNGHRGRAIGPRMASRITSGTLPSAGLANMPAPQPTVDRNDGAPGAGAPQTRNGVATPLARQNTSLGSFDILKLFELGPNGEPLNFAEVLASNPDWADQNADQSTDAGEPGRAQPLESSRNPGGGAEPAAQPSDGSLLHEALKLTGPVSPRGKDGQQLFSQTSLARLLSSDSFCDLVNRQSLQSQLSKDPSFTSAVFQSLLSQKSDDQAMLLSMLGVEQPSTSGAQPASKESAQNPSFSMASASVSPQQPTPPLAPPRLQLPEKGVQQSQLPTLALQAQGNGQQSTLQQGSQGMASHSLGLQSGAFQLQPPIVASQRTQNGPPVFESKVISSRAAGRPPTAPVRGQSNGIRNQQWQLFQSPQVSTPSPAARSGGSDGNKMLEQRVDSLDYMLAATSAPQAGRAANGQQSSISFKLPSGGGPAALWRPPQPPTPRLEDRGAAEGSAQFVRPTNQLPRYKGNVLQTAQQRIAAGLPPLAAPSPTQERPLGASGSRSIPALPGISTPLGVPSIVGPKLSDGHASSSTVVSPLNSNAQVSQGDGEAANKSKFLNGLITGIAPRTSQPAAVAAGPAAAAAAAASVLQLPKPVVQPLPPLPGVPSIQEYQRKLAPPGSQPRLEVLPLVGTSTPQVAPVRLEFRPDQLPVNSPAASAAARGYLKSWLVQTSAVQLPASTGLGAPKAGNNSQAVARSSVSVDTASSGSVAEGRAAKRARGGVTSHPRMTASSGSADARASEDGGQETGDEGDQPMASLDRKELRKAKNRASAAASRARREAYTASLEEEVKKLQKEQAWLKLQVEALSSRNGEGGSRPKRQLSI